MPPQAVRNSARRRAFSEGPARKCIRVDLDEDEMEVDSPRPKLGPLPQLLPRRLAGLSLKEKDKENPEKERDEKEENPEKEESEKNPAKENPAKEENPANMSAETEP